MNARNDSNFMWAEACALLERADRLQREFFQPTQVFGTPGWEPPVDLFESPRVVVAIVALPGVGAQQLQLVLDGAELRVVGERRLPAETAGMSLRRLEIPFGRFERRIPLPPGRFELAEHRLADGCLTLLLRRL